MPSGAPVGIQSTRPIQRSRFSAYQAIVCRIPSSHETLGSQPVSRVSFSWPTRRASTSLAPGRKRLSVETSLRSGGPVAVLLAEAQDRLRPVAHRDVLALPVDVDVAGAALGRDGEVAADPVRAEAEVAHRLQVAELDRLAGERLRDDRAGDVARVLARAVVVEHARDDAGHPERVEVVHRQEVGRDLRRRVDRLRVDRRALVEDEAARVVEVVVVRDGLADVPVLLRRPGGVELLDLELPVDDRLQEIQRPEHVRGDGLVRPVPGLADVRLRAEVEDVRAVGRASSARGRGSRPRSGR